MTNQRIPAPPASAASEQSSQSGAKRRWRPTRRGFLIGLGVTGVGLALGIGAVATVGIPYVRLRVAGMLDGAEAPAGEMPTDPWAWFEVLPDSRVRLYLAKVEMGQGIHTALSQIVVEELGVAWDDLEVAQATTARDLGGGQTGGSNSVSSLFAPLRQAAATFGEMLRAEAATQLGLPATSLVIAGRGFAAVEDPARRIDLAPLVAAKTGEWEVSKEPAPLKAPGNFQVIGQSLPRRDFVAKLTGQAVYGYDARLEGMKYGAVVRPPTIAATLKSVRPGNAATMAGVHTVVTDKDFAGVVADTRAQARAAADQMEVEWDAGYPWQQAELEAIVTVGNGEGIPIQTEGEAGKLLDEQTSLSAEYRSPFAVHAHLEAQAALADVKPDRVRVWCSTQSASLERQSVAKVLGVKEEIVEVIPTYLGGGFGRKLNTEAATEAARLSQAAGVPVHVGWTRVEDMRNGYFRPATHHQLSARLDDAGMLVAFEHRQASGDVAFSFFPEVAGALLGADFGAYRGATIRYAVPNKRTIAWRSKVPVRTGWWRGLGLLANTFALESFVDELAHAAGADPLAFRIQHLDDTIPAQQRVKAVLQAAAQLARWDTPAPEGRARGIACCLDVDTAVAMVAEVSVDRATGQIRVHHVSAAMDPGLVINPDGARAQVEGNVMWGVGSALIEEVTIKDGQIEPGNFDRYPLLTMKEAPSVDVVLLEAGDGKPRGVGEPPIGPVAAAIGNAVFALTGVRLRQLPMNAARFMRQASSVTSAAQAAPA